MFDLGSITVIKFLRIGPEIVFFWFGILKFFPGLNPTEALVRNTIYFLDSDTFIPILAAWETLIVLGLITGKFMSLTLLLLFFANDRHSLTTHFIT